MGPKSTPIPSKQRAEKLPNVTSIDQHDTELETSVTATATKVRLRTKAPKVRSGCVICKRRRIKCDERKPSCHRCVTRGLTCEYQVPKTWLFDPRSHQSSEQLSSEGIGHIHVSRAAEVSPFQLTLEEKQWLRFYWLQTGRVIAKYSHSRFDFFRDLLTRVAHQNPAIRHVVVAIAMYDSVFEISPFSAQLRERIAYHYGMGLRSIASGSYSVDIVLLMCIAAFVLESYQGNGQACMMHLNSARKIIQEYQLTRPDKNDHIQQLIKTHLVSLLEDSLVYTAAITLPPAVTKNDLDLTTDHWRELPAPTPYELVEDAEHDLIAGMFSLLRPTGETPFALLRARSFFEQWQRDFDACKEGNPDHRRALFSLARIGEMIVEMLSKSPEEALKMCQSRTFTEMMENLSFGSRPALFKATKAITSFLDTFIPRWQGAIRASTTTVKAEWEAVVPIPVASQTGPITTFQLQSQDERQL